MKIGIFETEHFEGSYPVIRLFDNWKNEVTVFTDPPTYKRFMDLFGDDADKFVWVVLHRHSSRLHFFWQLYREVKKRKLDLLYINTISSNHLLFAMVIKLISPLRVILTLHDINCMYRSYPSRNPRIMAHHLGKRWLIRLVKEFNVVSDTMVDYLAKESGGTKVIHNVPGAVFDDRSQPSTIYDHIHLVIPGSIDKKRRTYAILWPLLQAAESAKIPLRITILGGHFDEYGQAIIKKARAFKSHYTKLHCYDTHLVDQAEFDKVLDAAHFIFIPSVVDTAICHDIPEVYGLTKSSGNIFDVIKHARPFIVPSTLQIPDNLRSSAVIYDQLSDIVDLLQRLSRQPGHYRPLQEQAILNSKEYTIAKVRERNFKLFGPPA
jgi:hypothetical protein